MSAAPSQILTEFEIEKIVRHYPTATRRINTRRKLRLQSNMAIDGLIQVQREALRALRSRPEIEKRAVYAAISRLEVKKL